MQESNEQAVVRQWRHASEELAQQRRRDVANMTDDDARRATLDLFALVDLLDLPPRETSGLVEQQRLFAMARRPANRGEPQ